MSRVPMSRVEIRRPLVYLGVAAVLALAAGFLPGTTPSLPVVPPDVPAANAPVPPACSPQEVAQGSPPAPPPATPTMAAITRRGILRAGVDQSKYLTGFRNPQSGQLEGTDIDLVRAVAAAIFGDPNRVQFVVVAIDDRGPAVASGRVDLVVDDFAITCERARTVAFSAPYRAVSSRILVERNSGITGVEQLADKRVCTSRGSTHQRQVLPRLGLRREPLIAPGLQDCLVGMQRGEVDAAISDDGILAGLAAQDPQTVIVGPVLATSVYGVGMQRGQDEFVRFVNGVLARLPAGAR